MTDDTATNDDTETTDGAPAAADAAGETTADDAEGTASGDGTERPRGDGVEAATEDGAGATDDGAAADAFGTDPAEAIVDTTPSLKPTLVYLVATFAVGLAVVGYIFQNPTLLGDAQTTEILLNVAFVLWVIALARLLFRIYVLSKTTYFVTDRAVRREFELVYRTWSRELPIAMIRGHDRSRSRLQQYFEIGTISFLTAGNARSPGHVVFEHIDDDETVRQTIRDLVDAEQD